MTPPDPQKSLWMTLIRALSPPEVTSGWSAVAWAMHPLALLQAAWARLCWVTQLALDLGAALSGLLVTSSLQAQGTAPARSVAVGLLVGWCVQILADRAMVAWMMLSLRSPPPPTGGESTLQDHRRRSRASPHRTSRGTVGSIMVDWNSCPPQAGPARDAWLLDAIQGGYYEVELHELTIELPDHIGTFYVFADALKVGGVRINVSAYLQQQIADLLGASLLTPRLADLIYLARQIPLDPMPRAITSTTAAMIEQSNKIQSKIPGGIASPGSIVNTVGKHWVLVNSIFGPQARGAKKAANYGWHFEGASFQGIKGEPSVSLPGVRVIQGVGTAHNDQHTDYSQICQLVMRECWVDGEAWDVGDVMMDPVVSRLVMPPGAPPLQEDRQPGVPPLAPLDTGLSLGPNPHRARPGSEKGPRWGLVGALVVAAGAVGWWATR